MIKRIISIFCALLVICGMFAVSLTDVNAKESDSIQIDGSYLTLRDTSTGYTNGGVVTRGEHLMDGECSITKAGRGRIYVYASTTADHTVDYIATVIYVDRYNQETETWGQIDYWQVEDHNTYFVSTSKSFAVDRGYFYRVHADHVAGMKAEYPYEEATSLTDGIWID
ncbi:hypothetical protein GCM10008910_40460 [Faecalicatena orotica]|uniref:Uncharacterized protein n=1 Tax=Faecalicatena orotica TaxID=1544 RepID=A0A2Y9BP68_9FIRM|nr:DUF6147 family protein [Faecalicatena orotica]PWJ22964.1 hypothetical protein A8806_116141 [Faecalicatena orotica]SSA58100.1 hypothetical protein SAMN05216536_116141 [Faecalicatena orotica]